MTKITSIIHKIFLSSDFLVRLVLFLGGSIILLSVGYLLGWDYLMGIQGNDAMNAFNNVKWLATWWPRIPIWFPQQGAGVSLTWGYPIFPSITVILVSLWQKINLYSAFQILGFLSVPVTSIGIYLFVWRRLKNQTAGFIAGLFHLLMPASWVWLFDWGFYAEHFSYMFLFPALLFYDSLLDGIIKKDYGLMTRLSFFLSTALWGVSFAAHPTVFFSGWRIIFIYTPVYFLLTKKKISLQNLGLSIIIPAIVFLITVLGTASLTLSYNYYSAQGAWQNKPGLEKKEEFVYFYSVPFKALTGIGNIPDDDFKFTIRNLSFPPLIWTTAIVGTVLAFFISSKLVGLALAGWTAFFLLVKPDILFFISRLPIPLVDYFFNMRIDIVLAKVILPILSGFGIWGIPGLILKILTFWIKFKNNLFQWLFVSIRGLVASVPALILAGVAVYYFTNIPQNLYKETDVRYGPYSFDIRDPFSKWQLTHKCDQEKIENCRDFPQDISEKTRYIRYACGILKAKGSTLDSCIKFLELDAPAYDEVQTLTVACRNGTVEPSKKELCPAPESNDHEREIKKNCEKPQNQEASQYCNKYLSLASPRESLVKNFINECVSGKAKGITAEICPLVAENKSTAVKYVFNALMDMNNWPRMDLSQDFEFPFVYMRDFNQKYGQDQFLRIDVSPNLGGITQSLNMVNKASFINLYTVQVNLLGPYWGHQQQVSFQQNDGRIETKNEIAKWFGTKYLFFNNGLDADKIYRDADDWEAVYDEPGAGIFRYKDAPEVWSLTIKKPAVLVIGNKEKRAFEPVFRASNKGVLPYDEFLLVDGNEYIDDYSVDDLKKFDIIMLFGYKYRNMNKAWRNLDKYVKEGGNLFISTGWQYVDKDWRLNKTPAVMPVAELSWYDKFTKSSKLEFDQTTTNGIDISKFGPLEWNNVGWGVSLPGKVKDWAKPVLAADGKPLVVAGTYGKGKVVWSGLNLIGHMHTFEYNASEMDFMHALFTWLGSPDPVDLSDSVVPYRDYPDNIKFTFKEAAENPLFLFRESYFPNWKATLVSQGKRKNIDIFRAGPGFKLMRLPKIEAGDQLHLDFKMLPPQYIYGASSALTFLLLLIYVVFGNRILKPIFIMMRNQVNKYRQKLQENWSRDE